MNNMTYTHEQVAEIAKTYYELCAVGLRVAQQRGLDPEFDRGFALDLLNRIIPKYREKTPIEVRTLLINDADLGHLELTCKKILRQ